MVAGEAVSLSQAREGLLEKIRLARLSSRDRYEEIRSALITLRDAVHRDENFALSELYGPLGILNRLIDARYEVDPNAWEPKWRAGLATAEQFLIRASRS